MNAIQGKSLLYRLASELKLDVTRNDKGYLASANGGDSGVEVILEDGWFGWAEVQVLESGKMVYWTSGNDPLTRGALRETLERVR